MSSPAEPEPAVLRDPYRSKPLARTPAVSGRARRLAAHGATVVLVCLLFRWPVLLFSPAVVVAAEVFLVVGTWLFTLRSATDNRAARALAWVLRILATVDSAIAIVNAFVDPSLEKAHVHLSLFIVPAVGLAYLAARLHGFGLPQLTRKLATLGAACIGSTLFAVGGWVVSPFLTLLFAVTAFCLYLALLVWGFALTLRVRRILRVEAHEWWLHVDKLPQVEWTSYSHLADGRVELVGAGGERRWFDNAGDATFWLRKSGFRPDEEAVAQQLVDQAPASP